MSWMRSRNSPERPGKRRVRFCVPDAYSAARTVISLRHGGETREIACGVFKHMRSPGAFHEGIFSLPDGRIPEAARFSVTSYGGQGLCYVEARVQGGTFVPVAVGEVEGGLAGFRAGQRLQMGVSGRPRHQAASARSGVGVTAIKSMFFCAIADGLHLKKGGAAEMYPCA